MDMLKKKDYLKRAFVAHCDYILSFYEDFSGQNLTLIHTNRKGKELEALAEATREAKRFNNALLRPFITDFLNHYAISGHKNRKMLRNILMVFIKQPYLYKANHKVFFRRMNNYYKDDGIEVYTDSLANVFNTSTVLFLPVKHIPKHVKYNTYHLKKVVNSLFVMFLEYVSVHRSNK